MEEYKRPTFTAEIQEPTTDYQLGDTLHLQGTARTYTGLPVAGARVQWTANRSVWFRVESEDPVQSGEAITDAEGRFTLPVYLMASERERGTYLYNQFFFDVRCTITSDGGETAEAQRTVQASTQKAMLAEHGVTWNEVDLDAFTAACAPVYDWLVDEYGADPELKDKLVALVQEFRATQQ